MPKLLTLVIFASTLCFSVQSLASANTSSSVIKPVSVTDDLDRTIRLTKPAMRIVSLSPHITEMLFAAGAGQQVVGVVSYSNYPEAATKITNLGGYHQVDIERLLSLSPDLIIAWQTGNGMAQIEKILNLNIPVYITEPGSLEDIPKTIRHIGQLTGNNSIADQQSQAFLRSLASLEDEYSHQPKISVFYQVWDQPLITINGKHMISKLIELCGGANVFAKLQNLAPRIDFESVLQANPDVIITSGMDEEKPEWLDTWRSWDNILAVQHNNLFFIPPDIVQRHSPRILLGARRMCEQLEEARSKSKTDKPAIALE